jgi:threonine dehydrogenase-like Zn-dependent dehydrogenase
MKAVVFDGELRVADVSAPRCGAGEVLVRVTKAGICNTDLEIMRGYVPGFKGILGHEFVGVVEEADEEGLAGRRVTAEINFACGKCVCCVSGLQRHCPNRTVLGIQNRNGALAEYVAVPRENVVPVPDDIPDNRAVFIEPLAAALEILEQVPVTASNSALLLGDGKLGQLVARVLASTGCRLTVVGKHAHKLALLADTGASAVMLGGFRAAKHDIVVEATGSPSAFGLAMSSVKPRGTVVLKSAAGASRTR